MIYLKLKNTMFKDENKFKAVYLYTASTSKGI